MATTLQASPFIGRFQSFTPNNMDTASVKQFDQPNIMTFKRPKPLAIGYNDYGIDQMRKVLYRNFHEISGQIFLVEISRDPKKIFIILFPNFEKPHIINQIIALPEKLAVRLMQENGNRFDEFIKRFYLHFGKF